MEIYFADVGQGTSNVILLGNRRAIVIDTGSRSSDLRMLLNSLQIDEIPILVISHLDSDHSGGAAGILTEFRGRIGKVFFPSDHRTKATAFWKGLKEEINGGHFDVHAQLKRLEYQEKPQDIWSSSSVKLRIISPTFGGNQFAIEKCDSNATSGVLLLEVGTNKIVFPGDSSIDQWKEIHRMWGGPIDCNIIAIPHHGGIIWPNQWNDAQIRTALNWLYGTAVRPGIAIVSVGTSNDHGHPRDEVMQSLKNLNVRILCTQITKRCCADLESMRPGILAPHVYGRSNTKTTFTTSNNSKDVGCAGTVIADIDAESVLVRRLALHEAAVNKLPKTQECGPLCR